MAWDVVSVPEEAREWYRSHDLVLKFIRELVQSKEVTREEVTEIHEGVTSMLSKAVAFALASPHPDPEAALTDIFA